MSGTAYLPPLPFGDPLPSTFGHPGLREGEPAAGPGAERPDALGLYHDPAHVDPPGGRAARSVKVRGGR